MRDQAAGTSGQDLRRPEDDLHEVLRSLKQGLDEAASGFFGSLEQVVSQPFREAVHEISAAHARASAQAGLESESSSPEDPGTWTRYASYRSAVLSEVLEPLRDTLLERNGAQETEAAWASLRADILRLMAGLPMEVRCPEPPELYDLQENDGFRVRVGKGVVRFRRGLSSAFGRRGGGVGRQTGKKSPAQSLPAQTIPLRRLAEQCFQGVLSSRLETLREGFHRECAGPVAVLESAVAQWTKEWPLLETELEKGGGYLPEASRQAVSEAMEELLRLAQGSPADASEPPTSDGNGTASAEVTPAEERISPEAVAGGLTRALEHGGTFPAPEELCDQLVAMVESAWLEFLEHVRVAGTFMRSSPPSDSVPRAEERARAQDKACEAWIQWHRTAPNRLVLSIHLLRLMEGIAETREELVTGAAETVLLPLTEARESSRRAFRALAERAEKAFSQPKDSQDPAVLSDEVTGLLTEGLGVLDGSWGGFLTPDGIEDSIHALADGASTGLAGRLTILPDTISVQAVHSDDVALSPTKELQDVNLRETVRQVLDVLRLEKVRTAPEPLLDVLLSTREEVAGLPEALRFNLEAALDELTAPEDGSVTEEDMGEAASLTREGLARTEESLSRLLAGLSEGWQALLDRTDEILGSAFREIHGRLTADKGVQQQLGGIRDRVSHWFRTSSHEARIALGRVEKRARRTVKKWSVQALRAVRLGQAVVGTTPTEAGGGDRALSLIRQAPEVLAGLPLIYRRLFSFEPLTEGSLLKGRSEEEAWVRARFDSWGRGLCGPALLTGPVGAGHTSFFNVLSTSVFPETRLHRLELMDRVRSEDALTSLLWRAFEFDGDPPPSLADLGNSIRARASRGKPWVILIERLEHVFLRTPGGTDLFEDFLSLQAQTAGSVFWLSSMSGAAWKLVAKTEPRAASLVQVHPLTPPTRPELEELILARHGRSGLPIEFHPPSDLNPLVRRRLRRSRGEKAHQNILQTEFFDRLFRVSQDSIPLAILYWLRSTDFRSSEGKLFLTPPAEIRYSFLDNLDLELEFALKAFLEHGSLTLSEYQEVFAATPDEAVQTFEALRARLLLEPSGGDEGPLEHSEKRVEDKVGYRIPSLLSQVVARHLKNRNILH